MTKFRNTLEASLKLASHAKIDDAIGQLQDGLSEAVQKGELAWAARLSKHAALLCEQQGKLNQAKAFYRISMKHDATDPFLHWALADLCERLGQERIASQYFRSCFKLALAAKEDDLLMLLAKRGYSG